MNHEEVVREKIAIIRCDVIEGGWCGKWEELDEAERKPYLDEATQIISIKGLRIEADDQSLPDIPDFPVYSDKPYTDVEKQAFRMGALTYRNKMRKANWVKVREASK